MKATLACTVLMFVVVAVLAIEFPLKDQDQQDSLLHKLLAVNEQGHENVGVRVARRGGNGGYGQGHGYGGYGGHGHGGHGHGGHHGGHGGNYGGYGGHHGGHHGGHGGYHGHH